MATKGWLPYGSNHASVVFSDPLTVAFTDENDFLGGVYTGVTAGSAALGWTALGSSPHLPTHDPVLGMKAVSTTDGTTEVCYRGQTARNGMEDIGPEGQASIEIETVWAEQDSGTGFSGYTPVSAEALVSFISDPSTGSRPLIYKTANFSARGNIFFPVNDEYRNFVRGPLAPAKISRYGKGSTVTLSAAWKSNVLFFAVDGVVVSVEGQGSYTNYLGLFNSFLYLGSLGGAADGFVSNHWFRNFQVSNEAPEFVLSTVCPVIGVLSDSIFDDVAANSSNGGDNAPYYGIARKFEENAMTTNIRIDEYGGYLVFDSGPSELYKQVPALIAQNPVYVIFQGGTNDAVQAVTPTNFRNRYLNTMEALLGENGEPATKVEKVFICDIPPMYGNNLGGSYAQDVANKDLLNIELASIPALWDATYPARAGAVIRVPIHDALGGETPTEPALYIGQVTGLFNDLHLMFNGFVIYSDLIAETIFMNLE